MLSASTQNKVAPEQGHMNSSNSFGNLITQHDQYSSDNTPKKDIDKENKTRKRYRYTTLLIIVIFSFSTNSENTENVL